MIDCKPEQKVDVEMMYWDEEKQTTFTVVVSVPLKHFAAWKKATSDK